MSRYNKGYQAGVLDTLTLGVVSAFLWPDIKNMAGDLYDTIISRLARDIQAKNKES
jgi:hypothetical protein